MRVLRLAPSIVGHHAGSGGIGLHVHELSSAQVRLGHHVDVAVIGATQQGPAVTPYHRVHLQARSLGAGNRMARGLSKALGEPIAEAQVLHLHSHLYATTSQALASRWSRKMTRVVTNHGLESQSVAPAVSKAYNATVGRYVYRRADLVLCYVESEAAAIRKLAPKARIAVIPNVTGFVPAAPRAWAKRSIDILFVGRLAAGKRVDLLLEALAVWPKADPMRVTVVGDGPERAALEARAATLPDHVRVTFRGELAPTELPGIYADARVVALPSRTEGFPRVAGEALASRCAFVATTDLVQLRELAAQGRALLTAPTPAAYRIGLQQALGAAPKTVPAEASVPGLLPTWDVYARRLDEALADAGFAATL